MTGSHADRILNAVLDSGINFIDTSDDYGNSEELIGRYVSHRRDEYYLATKCGWAQSTHLWTRENVLRNLETSLRRLNTDYVDAMQLHNPTPQECEDGGLVDALEEMRRGGKVRWIGISTMLPDLPTYFPWGVFDTFQLRYSALTREHEDWLSKVGDAGHGIIIRGGVSLGEPGVGSGPPDRWRLFDHADLDELREAGETRTAFMLRFTLAHLDAHTAVVGTTGVDHLRENREAALRGPLPVATYEEAKRRLDETSGGTEGATWS